MDLDSIEVREQRVIVHLHATAPTAACPHCGTAGSRVHSRYSRTIADVAFGGRHLELKLLVRKWICPEASCSPHIFAERFPELVQRYARMTNRLITALQAVGVIANGVDAAQISSSFGVPTTAKTIIRRVLQLPLPGEGEVAKVGIDEWAWKKGQRYGTILVDLEKRRVVQLLAERSVETSQAWLRKHPEIDLVSRDRGKIFRDTATQGAPQAKQVVDRFHLQKNFAEALEKFFRKQEQALKTATQRSAGKTRSAARAKVPEKIAQERRARHSQRVSVHKQIWKLYRQGYHKEQIAQLVGVSSRSVYRALEQEAPPPPRRRSRSASIVDPYLFYLTSRWNQGCHNVARLYEEIVAQGYTGTQRTLQMGLRPFRAQGTRPVSKQTIILDKPPSPNGNGKKGDMPKRSLSQQVPKDMQARFEEITQLTDAFCHAYLNDEYQQLCRELMATLCRKRPSPLGRGKATTWACGIIHALGMANFLYDSSQTPHIAASQIWEYFELSSSTMQAKSKQIRDLLGMYPMDPDWSTPSMVDQNPLIWMLEVNGLIIDVRHAPREVQEAAFRQGLIPYIPKT